MIHDSLGAILVFIWQMTRIYFSLLLTFLFLLFHICNHNLRRSVFLRFSFMYLQCLLFVLMWCLFVDNSRQTTSSIPWHRATKYDLKLIHLYEMIPLQMVPRFLHVQRKKRGFACASCEKKRKKNGLDSKRRGGIVGNQHHQLLERGKRCSRIIGRSISMPDGVFDSNGSDLSLIPDSWFHKMFQTLFVLSCSDLQFEVHESNPNHVRFVFFFFSSFFVEYLDSWCQSTHVATILN